MVEVSESTVESLEKVSQENEIELERVREEFKERYEELESRSEGVSSDDIEKFALRQVRTWATKFSRTPSEEIQMLTIGGSVRETSNGDMFFGTALVDEAPGQDGSMTKLGAVRIFDEELASEIYSAFSEVGNVVTGEFTVSEGDLTNHVQVSDTDDTTFEVTQPDDRSALIDEIREHVPEVSIDSIADNLTATTRSDDGNRYTVSSDIRRIEADVVDGYKNPGRGFGIYTVRDETVFDEQDVVESDVFNQDEADENAIPGMTIWTDPHDMEYGSESVVEFFGTLTKNDDGEVTMNADGMVANELMATDFDGYEAEEDSASPEQEVGTSNVDRQKI